jgi:sugar phosphate isomerase/epimerase
MKFQLCAFADEVDSGIDGQIQALKENGVPYIELRGVDGVNVSKITLEKAKAIKEKFDLGGIKVWAIGSPTGKMDISDDFEAHLDSFKHMLEIARIVGASHYRLFSFYNVKDKSKAIEYLSRLIEASKGSDIVLCHENEKDIYGEMAVECLELHKVLPELKAVFDPANFIQAGQDTLKAWDMLEPYVEYIHIKDALANGLVVPAGSGIGNIPEILKRFKGKVLSIEPHLTVFKGHEELERTKPPEQFTYPDSKTAFKTAVTALRELF